MNEPVPFSTHDAILAFALENAGVPRYRPPTNGFTSASLTRLYQGKGLTLIQALRHAWKTKLRGEVTYWFEKTPELPSFLASYSDQAAQIDDPAVNQDGGEMVRRLIALAAGRDPATDADVTPMDEREALLRLTCVLLKGRALFMNLWKDFPPRLTIPIAGRVEQIAAQTTRHPGFHEIHAGMGDDMLQKMGLL